VARDPRAHLDAIDTHEKAGQMPGSLASKRGDDD
jgi:hypothetical protein